MITEWYLYLKMNSKKLIKELEQEVRNMFQLEAQRNEINFALSGVEKGDMTLKDYEDDLSVAISNWIVKDLLPKYGERT